MGVSAAAEDTIVGEAGAVRAAGARGTGLTGPGVSARLLALALGCCALLGPQPARAQDIEVEARARGRVLPQAYYQRVARRPDF